MAFDFIMLFRFYNFKFTVINFVGFRYAQPLKPFYWCLDHRLSIFNGKFYEEIDVTKRYRACIQELMDRTCDSSFIGRGRDDPVKRILIFIQNCGDLSQFCQRNWYFVTRVNDFKFCVDLGLRISNFANLSILQNFKFQIFSNFVQKILNITKFLWVLGGLRPPPLEGAQGLAH